MMESYIPVSARYVTGLSGPYVPADWVLPSGGDTILRGYAINVIIV